MSLTSRRGCLHIPRYAADRCKTHFCPRGPSEDKSAVINSDFNLKQAVRARPDVPAKSSLFSQAGHLAEKWSLFLTGGAWRWQPGPLPGTPPSDGSWPRPKKAKKQKEFWSLDSKNSAVKQDKMMTMLMEDIRIGCKSGCRRKGGSAECVRVVF